MLEFGCMRLPQKKGNPGDGKIDDGEIYEELKNRIEYPGSYYHAMNRCNRREDRFLPDKLYPRCKKLILTITTAFVIG
jgi:hypothetical protein